MLQASNCLICDISFEYEPTQQTGQCCSYECRGKLKTKHRVESGNATSKTVRKYMLLFAEYKCSECHITSWNNKDIKLQVDHIDGNVKNSLPNNLRWLCPNCHSQTETWGAANISDINRKKLSTKKHNMVRSNIVNGKSKFES